MIQIITLAYTEDEAYDSKHNSWMFRISVSKTERRYLII